MIKVELFVTPSLSVEKLSEPLSRVGIKSVSAMDMKTFDGESKSKTSYRGVLRSGKQAHKIKLEIILPPENQGRLFKMLKEILGPQESLTTPVFITQMEQVDSLLAANLA